MLPERGGLLRIVAQVLAQLFAAMRDQEEDHAGDGDDEHHDQRDPV